MAISNLSKGYLKPGNPTTGDLWFPAMETNIQLMNDHVHDGALAGFKIKAGHILFRKGGSDQGSLARQGVHVFGGSFHGLSCARAPLALELRVPPVPRSRALLERGRGRARVH